MEEKLTPLEALDSLVDTIKHLDTGFISKEDCEAVEIIREALQPKDSTYYLDLHNRALADEYESLKQAVRNVMSTEDMYCADSLGYYIDKHENDEDFFEQLGELNEAQKLAVFQEALHIFKRPWLKSILEEVKDSGKSPYDYRAREMYNYYYIYLPKEKEKGNKND